MINRTTLSIVVFTALFTSLSALSTSPSSCYAQPLPKSGQKLTNEKALDIINELMTEKENISRWRQKVEECITNNKTDEFVESTSFTKLRTWRRETINKFDLLATIYQEDKQRSSLFNAAKKDERFNKEDIKFTLLELFQEAFLLEDATYQVYSKLKTDNLEQIYESNNFSKGYKQFLHNSGIDLADDYKAKTSTAYNVLKCIRNDISERRNQYRTFILKLTSDFQDMVVESRAYVEENNKLTKELNEIKNQLDIAKSKLGIKFQAELQEKIKQIQEAGEGTIDIPFDFFNEQQKIRFIYVSPGKYYIGNDEELNKKLTELAGHSMRKFAMNEITLKSGFFIMEDKITPEQLQALTNNEFQVPNGLTWKQAMESAEKANLLLSLILNGMTVRLPTEIEWECAVRGKGSKNLFPWGNENPDKNPDEDVTALGIKHAASIFAEWCIDKKMDNYGVVGTLDPNKAVTYFPNSNPPYLTYYCVGLPKENRAIVDLDSKSPALSFRVYKGASDEDINKKNFQNRTISMQRSISDDVSKPNVSFRLVLIPQD